MVQRAGIWAGCGPAQFPSTSTSTSTRCTGLRALPSTASIYQLRIIRCGTTITFAQYRVKFVTNTVACGYCSIHGVMSDTLLLMIYVEIYTPTDFAVVGRSTETNASFVDGPSSALLQPSPAAGLAVSVVADSCWTNTCGSVRRPPKSLPVANLRHCSTLGPGRSRDRRHVPLAGADFDGRSAAQGPSAGWLGRRLMRLCRDDLRFLEKLGEGRLAEVDS